MQRKLDEIKSLQVELKQMRAQLARGRAAELAASAVDGVVVQRVDGVEPGDLRDLAIAVRQQPGVRRVVLMGATPTGGASLVAAVQPSEGIEAADLIKAAAKAVGGGGGGKGDIATAGGKDPSGPRRGDADRDRGRHRVTRRRRQRRAGARRRSRHEADRPRDQRPLRNDRLAVARCCSAAGRDSTTTPRSPASSATRKSRSSSSGCRSTWTARTGLRPRLPLAEARRLATVVGVPVELHDERRTTVSADRSMLEAGLNAVERRQRVDKVAAAIMLQSWLDARVDR